MNPVPSFAYHKLNALWAYCMEVAGRVDIIVNDGPHLTHAALKQAVNNGRLVINIGSNATKHLNISTTHVSAESRFKGQICTFMIPISQILGVRHPVSGVIMALHLDVVAAADGWMLLAETEVSEDGLPLTTVGEPVAEHTHAEPAPKADSTSNVTSLASKRRPGLTIVK